MPGRWFSRTLCGSLAAGVLVGLVGFCPSWMRGSEAGAAPDDVPTWCHQGLQLLSEPTGWIGYRSATLLKRQFQPSTTAPVYYRGFAADRNMYMFQTPAVGGTPEQFATEAGVFDNLSARPTASDVSVRRRTSSSNETLVWCVLPGALQAVRANEATSLASYGQVSLPETPLDIAAHYRNNNYVVYGVLGADGIQVYQLPALNWVIVQERGRLDTPGDALRVVYEDSLLYVADGIAGVEIVDVKNLDQLTLAGHYQTAGPAKSVFLADTLLFVAEWEDGVEILDVSDPDTVSLVAHIDTPGRAHDVAADDSLLFVADWDGGLRVYNFARPAEAFLAGFYGVGGEYLSVAVADSFVIAGSHTGLQVFRYGKDRQAPTVTATMVQTPVYRDRMRAYVLASECLAEAPTVQQIVLPRQTVLEDYDGYASNDTLRLQWTAQSGDSVVLSSTAYAGDHSMAWGFALAPRDSTKWVAYTLDAPADWRLYDRLSFRYRAAGDSVRAQFRARVRTADDHALRGSQTTVYSGWREYTLDLSQLPDRSAVDRVELGLVSTRTDSTSRRTLLADHFILQKVDIDPENKAGSVSLQDDPVDIPMEAVGEDRSLYLGEFELVASDTGLTNALVVTATDNTGNTSTTLKEYRAQLVVPETGGELRSPDSRLSLLVPPGATSSNAYFYIIPVDRSREMSSLPSGASRVGCAYDVGQTAERMEGEVRLVFRPDRAGLAGVDPADLGVYRLDGSAWVYAGGEFDAGSGTVTASLSDLGTVALLAHPGRPEIPPATGVDLKSYPNPFNPTTTLAYTCPTRSPVVLQIFDVSGRLVNRLVDGIQGPGTHFVTWDGRTEAGIGVMSGVYFARLEVGSAVRSIKIVVIR